MKITEEVRDMFRQVRVLLGAPVRMVQLEDDALCALLEVCVQDYAERVQNWLIEQQWVNMFGGTVSKMDWAMALSTRTLNFARQYAYWHSKMVGLQQDGPWEQKKDYFTIERGKQDYIIPAGREINKVLYVNPPTSQAAMFANYGGWDVGFGGGFAQLGGGVYGPVGGFYTAPAADVAYLATDLTYKSRLLRGDLVYTVTAGPDGTHIIHLLSTPGSPFSFNWIGGLGTGFGLVGCHVWYTYYDTDAASNDDCKIANSDILLTPDQVPLSKMELAYMNEPTKVIIRQLLVAKAKQTLGIIRGTNSGKILIPRGELQLDYQMLLTQAQKEWDDTMKRLDDRLQRMSPAALLKTQADIIDANMKVLNGTPLGIFMI